MSSQEPRDGVPVDQPPPGPASWEREDPEASEDVEDIVTDDEPSS